MTKEINEEKIKNTHDAGEAEVTKPGGDKKRPADKKAGGDKTADTSAAGAVTVMPSGAVKKEDLDILFDGTELSEEFQDKAFTLFEGAVSAKVAELRESIEAEYEEKLEESVSSYEDKLSDFIDLFVENYMQENELAIERGIKAELGESLLEGLKELIGEHNIDIPEDKVQVVESLTDKVGELESELNEAQEKLMTAAKLVESYKKKEIFDELTEDMDEVSKDKLFKLTENISFKSDDSYRNSVSVLKESVSTSSKKVTKEDMLNEEVNINVTDEKNIDPTVKRFLDAIRK